VAALKLRQAQQETDRGQADGAWIDTGLVFTTRQGYRAGTEKLQSQLRSLRRQSPGT
jgi:hypothetical protein